MGPSYMEDDTRALTDAKGFCSKHIKMVYDQDNRLGMAWVMKTHFDKTINDIKKVMPSGPAKLIKKGISDSPLIKYIDNLDNSCFVCDRINNFFDQYVDTIFFLWKKDDEFKEKFKSAKGFCTPHYSLLLKKAVAHLKGDDLESFVGIINDMYITNMERVRDDLAWFINKFDYKYQNEPWYNAKDSVKGCRIFVFYIHPLTVTFTCYISTMPLDVHIFLLLSHHQTITPDDIPLLQTFLCIHSPFPSTVVNL